MIEITKLSRREYLLVNPARAFHPYRLDVPFSSQTRGWSENEILFMEHSTE